MRHLMNTHMDVLMYACAYTLMHACIHECIRGSINISASDQHALRSSHSCANKNGTYYLRLNLHFFHNGREYRRNSNKKAEPRLCFFVGVPAILDILSDVDISPITGGYHTFGIVNHAENAGLP